MRRRWAAALVRLYPARWRSEYGAELFQLLAARPLGPRAILDVAWSALRQQALLGEPWLILGLPLLAYNLFQWTRFILYPRMFSQIETHWIDALRFAPLYLATGFWTVVRKHGTASSGAVAACKLFLLQGLPTSLIGLLTGLCILRISTIGSHATLLVWLPVLQLPKALVPGWLGGAAARSVPRLRRLFHR